MEMARLKGTNDRGVGTLLKRVVELHPSDVHYIALYAQWLNKNGNFLHPPLVPHECVSPLDTDVGAVIIPQSGRARANLFYFTLISNDCRKRGSCDEILRVGIVRSSVEL